MKQSLNLHRMSKKSTFFISFLGLAILFFANPSLAANRYWVGSGAGNWNSTANWSAASGGTSGASVPGAADMALFNSSNVSNCAVDAHVNVAGISISGYTGTISFNAGMTATIGTSGFSQSSGTVTGNNGAITCSGAFSLSGGTFNATSGNLQVASGFTHSAGTFNPGTGTLVFSNAQTITGNTSTYNLLFSANGTYTIASGTMLISTNNVTISGTGACTINTGTVEIKGNLTLASSFNNSVNGGNATFLFNGTGTQNITSAISAVIVGTNERMCALPNVEINKTSGALNLSGVITLNGTSWKTTAGAALVNAGTSTVNIISSVTFSGENLSLYRIHIWANSQAIVLSPASYVLTCTDNLTINGGSHYQVNTGTLELLGDLTLIATSTSSVNGGTGTFLFDGTGTQTINSSVSSLNNECGLPSIQINKTSGALNLVGIINFSGSSWNTVAGASLINPGTSTVNLQKTTTLSGQDLSLYDLMITGNFSTTTISPGLTWTSTHLLTLAGGASWYQINTGTLNAKGDCVVSNSNTTNNVGGSATILFTGAANQSLTGSGVANAGRLPNVQIDKTGGTLTLYSLISTDNHWTYIAGTVDAVTNGSTVDFCKSAIIDGQGTSSTMAFNHVIISAAMTLGGILDVNGDFTIRSGATNQLDITTSNYLVSVAGSWTNNNSATATSFNQRSGKVIFDGAGASSLTLASTSHTETFYQLEMNGNGSISLNAPLAVSNAIRFVNGKIVSTASAPVLLLNAVTSTGASNSSFVSGPVSKTGNQAFVFPTGKNSVYAPISISALGVNTNQFTAEYFQTSPNPLYNVTSKDASLDHVSICEYWKLDQASGSSAVTVTLSWDTRSCGVVDLAGLRVAEWNGSLWKDMGNGGTSGTYAAGTIVSGAAIATFGVFTLGTITDINPLPVEFVSFTGECVDRRTVLEWSTASETNSESFTPERSTDGITWTALGTVGGAGNSNSLQAYSFTCPATSDAIDYYRLKQTDQNGAFKYSENISVANCSDISNAPDWTVYPNPASGVFYLQSDKNSTGGSLTVFNGMQAVIFHADNFPSQLDLTGQPDGVYFMEYLVDGVATVKRVVLLK